MLIALPFNRLMETEADEVGLQLASKACFDIREAPVLWAKMNAISEMKVTNFIHPAVFGFKLQGFLSVQSASDLRN